jgi:hypothetical protein
MKTDWGKFMILTAALAGAMSLAACSQLPDLDVVGRDSVASFEKILSAIPDRVTPDEAKGGWSIEAPSETARFIWSENYSATPLYDVMLELDARPFIDAGLDISKLPENYTIDGEMLLVGTDLGDDELTYEGDPAPLAAYEQLVDRYRDAIGYHTALDHYNIDLGGGNLFEWAKDFAVNSATKEAQDKDIVFVLNPEPFITAGVDPETVDGWVYAPVTVDIGGKPAQVYKFLQPFDLQ